MAATTQYTTLTPRPTIRVETYPGSGRMVEIEDFDRIDPDTGNIIPAAPRPAGLAPLPPSADFLATLKTPIKPWLIDFSDADLKANLRSDLARHDVKGAHLYAAELARRNTLRQMERELGYAALATFGHGVAA